MPFRETCRMEERVRMLSEYETGNWIVSELCRRYGVCRDTFYEWRKRRRAVKRIGSSITRMRLCTARIERLRR